MSESLAEQIKRITADRKAEKATYVSVCDDLAHYFDPKLESYKAGVDGSTLRQPELSTGVLCAQRLVNGLHSNTMAMSKGNIVTPDDELMEDAGVKEALAYLSKQTHHQVIQSGFGKQYQKWLGGYVVNGGAVIYTEGDKIKKTHRFEVFPESACFYGFDNAGKINEMYREYELTGAQAVAEFGSDGLPARVIEAYTERKPTKFNFIHCMRERRDRNENALDAKNMKYESIDVCISDGTHLIREGGSMQFRYSGAHFYQRIGENTGRSPAFQGLPIMKQITATCDKISHAAELAGDPPVSFPDRDAAERFNLMPGEVGWHDPEKGAPWTYTPNVAAIKINQVLLEQYISEINDLFFVDLFMMLEQQKGGAKTAFEVDKLLAERTQAIAPVANGLNGLFEQVYGIVATDLVMWGQIPDMPVELFGDDGDLKVDVVYTSRLDTRLREVANYAMLQATNEAVTFATALAESPLIAATVKPIKAMSRIYQAHNVDPEILYNEDEAEDNYVEFMDQRAQAAEAEAARSAIKPIDTQKAPESGSPAADIISGEGGAFM